MSLKSGKQKRAFKSLTKKRLKKIENFSFFFYCQIKIIVEEENRSIHMFDNI